MASTYRGYFGVLGLVLVLALPAILAGALGTGSLPGWESDRSAVHGERAVLPAAAHIARTHAPQSTFTDSGQLLGGDVESSAVALGDLDGDGDLDAVVATSGGSSKVYLNQGGDQGGTEGVFLNSGQSLAAGLAVDVELRDLDGDTDLDAFFVKDAAGDANEVWLNQGIASGLFTQTAQTFGDSLSTSVALGDLDGANGPDAFIGRGFGQPSKVWFNSGNGSFSDSGQTLDTDSSDIALGDLDGDSDLDAFSSNGGDNKVWANQGGAQMGMGGFFLDSGQVLTSTLSLSVILGDIDGDGDLDAWAGNSSSDRIWTNQGGMQGGIEGVFLEGALTSPNQTRDVTLGDLDSDGDLDAFLAKSAGNEVWINQGGDEGGTEGAFMDSGQILGNSMSEGVALGDVDGDGDLDAFVANWGQPDRVWLNQASSPIPVEGWQIQAVDSRARTGQHSSLVLDDLGRPHISYVRFAQVSSGSSDTLWYAYWDGVRWQTEVVDQHQDIESTSLALDDLGQPHIGYSWTQMESPTGSAAYATRNASEWQIETVDARASDGQSQVSLVLDGNQNPHMAYHASRHAKEVRYAQKIHGVWLTETVASLSSIFPIEISLALDTNNRPHIGYFDHFGLDRDSGAIKYAHDDGSGWQIALVEDNVGPSTSSGLDPTLVLDGNGTPHISYINRFDVQDDRLKYATLAGGSWLTQVVPTADNDLRSAAMQLDSAGEAHIVYSSRDMVYTYWDGANWQSEPIVESAIFDEDLSLVLDAEDRLHVTYYERRHGDLHYLSRGPSWQFHTLDDTALARSPAIDVMDAAPFINYYDETGSQVLLAEWNAGWTLNPAAFVGNPELRTSLVTGLSHRHASYYDGDLQRLMYGRWNGSNWAYRVVDDVGDVGRFNDIVLLGNADDRIRIAYWDATALRVKLAVLDFGAPVPDLFTNTAGPALDGSSGYVSAATLPGWQIGISYYDGVNGNLRLAVWNPAGNAWTDRLVDGLLSDVGQLNDLQTDGTEGVSVVAYYDSTNDTIKFAYELANGAFHLEDAVPGAGGVSRLSLALGLNSRHHARIAFTTTGGALKLASLREGIWEIETVLSGGGPSSQVSLALDLRPHLAYAQTTHGLQYIMRTATLLPSSPDRPYQSSTGGYYNPLDACGAVLEFFFPDRATSPGHRWATPVTRTQVDGDLLGDFAIFDALSSLFAATPGGQHYINLYRQHGSEMGQLGLDDPQLLWDAYGTLQNFLPGLEALVTGKGDEFLVTQAMMDDALDIWQRLVAAGSPVLANTINGELAKYNDLQDFVGMSFDEWAQTLGVATERVYLPVVRGN